MIKKKSNSFLSCDGKTSVHVVMWCPDETEYDKPVAVLQICHGMIEYIDRYDGFARYMAERGFVVVGNDHLGHGKSVCTDDDLGFLKIRIRERHLQRMPIILQFLSGKCIQVFHIILQDTAWGHLLQEDIYVITDMNLMELL